MRLLLQGKHTQCGNVGPNPTEYVRHSFTFYGRLSYVLLLRKWFSYKTISEIYSASIPLYFYIMFDQISGKTQTISEFVCKLKAIDIITDQIRPTHEHFKTISFRKESDSSPAHKNMMSIPT